MSNFVRNCSLSPFSQLLLFRQLCVMMNDVASDQLTDNSSSHHIGREVIQPTDARQGNRRRESIRTEDNERLVVIPIPSSISGIASAPKTQLLKARL